MATIDLLPSLWIEMEGLVLDREGWGGVLNHVHLVSHMPDRSRGAF